MKRRGVTTVRVVDWIMSSTGYPSTTMPPGLEKTGNAAESWAGVAVTVAVADRSAVDERVPAAVIVMLLDAESDDDTVDVPVAVNSQTPYPGRQVLQ